MSNLKENFNNKETFEPKKAKKFVFQIYDENIDFIEALTYERKNSLINSLINDYKVVDINNRKNKAVINGFKTLLILTLSIIICVPLLIFITNFSLKMTLNSYAEMQRNFEKLF